MILSEILAGLLAGMVALGGLVAWRLHAGPVPLDFMTPHLETALRAEGRGYAVDIEQTVAVWAGWRDAIDIRATGVVLTGPDGAVLAVMPELSLGLSLRALLRGRLAPTILDAIAPTVRVVRHETGEFALGFTASSGVPDNDAGAVPSPLDSRQILEFLIEELLSDPDPSRAFGYLRRVSILDAQIVIEDRVAGSYFRAPDAEVVLLKDARGISGTARAALQYGTKSASFVIDIGLAKEDLSYFADLRFRDVESAAFAPSIPQLAAVSTIRMPLSGQVSLEGRLGENVERVGFDLAGGAGRLELFDLFRDPVPVELLRLTGDATADFSTIRISDAEIVLEDATIRANASLVPAGSARRATLSASAEDFPIAQLHRYWPVSLQPAARRWVTTNIYDGLVERGTIYLALSLGEGDGPAVSLETLDGTLEYADLGIRYFKDMTPVTGITGNGTFDRDGFYLLAEEGSLASDIALSDGMVDVVNLRDKANTRLIIDATAMGPLVTALNVLDEDPLNYGRKLGFDTEGMEGDSVAQLHFELPLVKNISPDMLEVAATAHLIGTAVPNGPFGLAVGDGEVDLDITRARLNLDGEVRLNGVPASLAWQENFEEPRDFQRRFQVTGTAGDADRAALGLPDLGRWIEGKAQAKVTYTVRDGRLPSLKIVADLAAAAVKVPEANWRKEPGASGRLAIDARVPTEGGLVFDRLHFRADDAEGTMRMEFLPDLSDIATVVIEDARIGESDVTGRVTRAENGGYRIEVEGQRADVRHFLNDDYARLVGAGTAPAEPGNPLFIKAKFREAVTGDGRRMHRGSFAGRYDGANWEAVILNATLGEGGSLTLNYGLGQSGSYELLVESSDAGQTLRTLDWWDEVQGGSLVIRGTRESVDGPLRGTVAVRDFRLAEAPAGIKLLQLLTVIGLPAAVAETGVSFIGLDGSYTYHDEVLTLGEVEAWGPVGVHINSGGKLDFDKDEILLVGVVVPANAVQGVIGKIPLVGLILGDGLIATNFTVKGPLEDPKVTPQAASTFAPGFLRKLFRSHLDKELPPDTVPGAESPRQDQ